MLLDVRGLVSDGNFGKTWQIDEGQTENIWRVDLEVDGLSVDALVATSDAICLLLDFALDLGKVIPFPARNVIKLSPLFLSSDACWSVRYVYFVILWSVARAGDIDQLEDQWSSGDDSASSREKVSTDDVF